MREPDLVARIVEAVVRAVDVPVTLKIRTGWDAAHRNAPEIARIAEDAGIAALAVHGRTRDQQYAGTAEYDTIAAIKAMLRIPVVANGDIDSRPRPSRCSGDRLRCGDGRPRRPGRPWLLGQIAHHLAAGAVAGARPGRSPRHPARPPAALHAFYGESAGCASRASTWAGTPGTGRKTRRSRAVVNRAQSADEQLRLTRDYFDALAAGVAPGLPAAA